MQFLKKTLSLQNKSVARMMLSQKRPSNWAALFFLSLTCTFVACEKPERDLGLDLQPEESILGVGTVDTFTVIAFTLPEDSIRSDKVTPALLGAYIDPAFGFVKAGHVTELRLSSSGPVFVPIGSSVNDIQVDSVVLTLAYNYTEAFNTNSANYGGLGAQFIQLFETTDSLAADSSYFHTKKPRYIPEDLIVPGNNLVIPAPADSVIVGGVKIGPEIRIRLKNSFSDRFFNLDPGQELTATEFISLLKGIYVTVDETQFDTHNSGIIYFDTFNDRSKITMYYRNTLTEDTVSYAFEMRGNTGKYNTFDHDRTLAEAALYQQVVEGEDAPGLNDLYIQAMGGTKIRIDFPHFNDLRSIEGISINQAALYLPLREGSTKNYAPPEGLFVLGLDVDGNAFLIDDQLDGSAFVDGIYDADKNAYRFKISRFLQQVLLGEKELYGLEIVTSRAAFSANRVLLNGPEYPDPLSPDKNLKLAITFTEF